MALPIEFYFDFSSPYSYFASVRIDDLAGRYARAVRWRPILLGAAFKVSGMQPLLDIPLKSEYARRDIARFARLLDLHLRLPEKFPFAAVAASRAFYWLDAQDEALAKRFAKAIFRQVYAAGADVGDADFVCDLASGMGIARDDLKTALASAELKEKLRAEVDAAVAKGVFGAPYIVVDGEPFWGADRLPQIEEWLATGGW
jgi:2-hydroxychromene-2-carboxylate isomerase